MRRAAKTVWLLIVGCGSSWLGLRLAVGPIPSTHAPEAGGGRRLGRGEVSAKTVAAMGNWMLPRLRTATVLGPRGVARTALNGRSLPSSMYTRTLHGVFSGPCQSVR